VTGTGMGKAWDGMIGRLAAIVSGTFCAMHKTLSWLVFF
jgi:hypothetical protein